MNEISLPLSNYRFSTQIGVIAKKEISDAFRNRLFQVALIMLLVLSLIAIGLGVTTVHSRVAEYNRSVQILQDLGRNDFPPMPTMNPIAISKSFINYLAMVGALLAIIMGYTSIQKERQGGTLPLILSRAVYRDQLLSGKMLGNAILLAALSISVGVITVLALTTIGGVTLTAGEFIKLSLTMVMSWLYMMIFFLLVMLLTIWLPSGKEALLLTVIIWLVFAFIFPQIGDTMDLDNQIPGGFFASMGMDKAQATAALQHFKWYEKVRDGVEELSPTKHYERISFALLGVKTEFITNTWFEVLQLKWINLIGLIVPNLLLMGASYVVFLRREI